jgi:hypothetical protein
MRLRSVPVVLAACLFAAGCSRPKDPVAGNYVPTYVSTTIVEPVASTADTSAVDPVIGASTLPVSISSVSTSSVVAVVPESVAASTAPTDAVESSVPVFVPPSSMVSDDPNIQEAIRVRIAVNREYKRQSLAGVAEPEGFAGLADKQKWIPVAMKQLRQENSSGVVTRAGTVDGIVVTEALYQSPNEILLTVCEFNDDVLVATLNTPVTIDDEVLDDSFGVQSMTSLMSKQEGKWIYEGSAVQQLSC